MQLSNFDLSLLSLSINRGKSAHNHRFLMAQTQKQQIATSEEDGCNQNDINFTPASSMPLTHQHHFDSPLMPSKDLTTSLFVLFFTTHTSFSIVFLPVNFCLCSSWCLRFGVNFLGHLLLFDSVLSIHIGLGIDSMHCNVVVCWWVSQQSYPWSVSMLVGIIVLVHNNIQSKTYLPPSVCFNAFISAF